MATARLPDGRATRISRRCATSYLLRSNVTGGDPAKLWAFYSQLIEAEQAYKVLKGDLAIRPIYHQTDERIAAHIIVASLSPPWSTAYSSR
jgi:hypothetical protein